MRYTRYICDVADCNIRNIDDELMVQMRVAAAGESLTLREWAIRAFEQALIDPQGFIRKSAQKPAKQAAMAKESAPARSPAFSKPKHAESCPCLMCKPPEVKK